MYEKNLLSVVVI